MSNPRAKGDGFLIISGATLILTGLKHLLVDVK
jgi:hypothetical protein